MTYQQQLKAILQATNWSQEELARRCRVSFAALNAWVNARSVPRPQAAETIRLLYVEMVGVDAVSEAEVVAATATALALKTTIRRITEDEEILNRLTLHLTYHTNTIEGSTMTLADTEAVLFQHKVLTNRTQVEQAEARNHQAALLWALEQLSRPGFAISEEFVTGLHLRLMNGIMANAGAYRQHGVRIMGAHGTLANYQKVPDLMAELLATIGETPKDVVGALANTHAEFEKIHPFSDGNGRVGRLILLAQALQAGLVPPLVLKERKLAYYKYLELAQTHANARPLQLFIAEAMVAANQLLFE